MNSLMPVLSLPDAETLVARARAAGQTIVFTNGVFDLLHPGHVRYLQAARRQGDLLIVGLNSDRSVRVYKGADRPIVPEAERAEILAALACVDAVVIFDEETPDAIVRRLQPDVLVKGADWPADQVVGRDTVEARGGTVVRVPVEAGYSTSEILRKIRGLNRSLLVAAAMPILLSAQSTGLSGTWVGSGTLTNNWTDASDPNITLRCAYIGKAQPPSITLTLPPAGGLGQLVLDIPSTSASCPALRKRFQIQAEIAGTRLTFTDPAGDRWTLTLTKDLLNGEVTWSASETNPSEALAVGFTYRPPLRPWDVPLTRLSGKVTLRRATAAAPPRQ